MNVAAEDIENVSSFFGDLDVSIEQHVDWIFVENGQKGCITRFTNGSHPVFYTALENRTAGAEVAHWLPKKPGSQFIYRVVAVEFEGHFKNLLGLSFPPPFLTGEPADGAYEKCRKLAEEAIQDKLDALKTPSARNIGGCCVPILTRTSIRKLTPGEFVSFTLDDSGHWVIRTLGTHLH